MDGVGKAALIGRSLGDFVVRERIGDGGSATVFTADQQSLGREVVVKVLRGGRRASPDAVARFLREAKLASRFEHPFAAHVYAFGAEPDGVVWIAMERVRGTALDRVLDEQGPLPLPRLAALLDRLGEVIAAAQDQGIVHRDIKPANVMVTSSGGRLSPVLLDFGVAKLDLPRDAQPDGDEESEPPGARDLIGSPLYMAPEQWATPDAVDGRADVYALAVLAFEAATGVRPFEAASLHAIAQAHATRPPPRVPATLPATLDLVFARALAKAPADRYASAAELA